MLDGSYATDAADPDYGDLRATARRALEFERGFLRRRWAWYYAAWSAAVTAYFLVPSLLSFTPFAELPTETRYLTYAGIDLLLTGAAMSVTVVLWGLARRTSDLRFAANGPRSLTGPRNLVRLAVVLAVVAGSIAVSTRSDLAAFLVGDTTLVALAVLLLFHLQRAFRPVPPEGWLASGAFLVAAGGSYVSLLLLNSRLGHEIAWAAGVVIWLGCAAYARFGVRDRPEGA